MKNKSKIRRKSVVFYFIGAFLVIYTVLMLYLFFWGFITSLKATKGVFNVFRKHEMDFLQGWPWQWEWKNYSVLISKYLYTDIWVKNANGGSDVIRVGFLKMTLNSIFYAGGGSLVATIVPLIMAYATAKFDYKFNAVIDATVLVCIAVPVVGSQPSEIMVLKTLGLFDRWTGYFIQRAHFLSVYYLIFQAAFKSIPKDYSEAAQVEGAGYYRIMFQLIIPLVGTIFLTIFLMNFIAFWNDYTYPLLYLHSKPTLAYGIYFLVFKNGENQIANEPMKMAGSFIMFIPILVIFLCFRKALMKNLSMGGIKE